MSSKTQQVIAGIPELRLSLMEKRQRVSAVTGQRERARLANAQADLMVARGRRARFGIITMVVAGVIGGIGVDVALSWPAFMAGMRGQARTVAARQK
jgi:hypothetical protein